MVEAMMLVDEELNSYFGTLDSQIAQCYVTTSSKNN